MVNAKRLSGSKLEKLTELSMKLMRVRSQALACYMVLTFSLFHALT